MQIQTIALIGGGIGGGVMAVLGVGRACVGAWRTASRIERIHRAVERELSPNGGTSLKDEIGRIDRRVAVVETHLNLSRSPGQMQ